jgi:NAD+ synthase (glutamine-hydrolysing)
MKSGNLMKKLRIAIAQMNPTVGDLPGNVKKIISNINKARRRMTDVIVFPELAVTGYPPEDLVLKPQFIRDNLDALKKVVSSSPGITVIVGYVDNDNGLYNAAAVISDGRLIDVYHKTILPNYGVFDEFRYFKAGRRNPVYRLGGVTFGVSICEDIWDKKGPLEAQVYSGAELIFNINASPYRIGKPELRDDLIASRARESGTTIVYANMIGGQDELVFDGGSFIKDRDGNTVIQCRQFSENLVSFDLEIKGIGYKRKKISKGTKEVLKKAGKIEKITIPHAYIKRRKPSLSHLRHSGRRSIGRSTHEIQEVYKALLLGTKDYVRKNGFNGVVIGLSGGIDSALVAVIAVDALGKENVRGLFMPSQYSSKESRDDAHALAKNLGIELADIPIKGIYNAYLKTLAESFRNAGSDITEENIQARIRGNILMAFSNKYGWLVLTTGNKSEMSVGYATLYGDMAGGFGVIKDVPKTMVYDICNWLNKRKKKAVIPERILWKEPSAELRPDQRDSDTLPPYPVLDPVLKAYVEEEKSFDEIMKMGCDLECAQKVIGMVDHSEYKRRQAPPGIKITRRAFGKDRRFPITNKYKSY